MVTPDEVEEGYTVEVVSYVPPDDEFTHAKVDKGERGEVLEKETCYSLRRGGRAADPAQGDQMGLELKIEFEGGEVKTLSTDLYSMKVVVEPVYCEECGGEMVTNRRNNSFWCNNCYRGERVNDPNVMSV